MDNYLKTLDNLYQFRGDGKLHEVEHLFEGCTVDQIIKVLRDLEAMDYIELQGGNNIVIAVGGIRNDWEPVYDRSPKPSRKPYKARINLKEIHYYETKNENNKLVIMDNKSYSFNAPIHNAQIGDNNTQTNYTEIEKQITQAISDSTISSEVKNFMLADLENIKFEKDKASKESKVKKFINDYGATIGEAAAKVIKTLAS